ncbi:hypothetical protein MMC11_001388 [Xylographa trunciseda]|nr:hypothetical protein [Xylographa trunciseda]
MREAVVIWVISILLHCPLTTAADPPPGPPFFMWMAPTGNPNHIDCFHAIAQCPSGRDITVYPDGLPIQPHAPIQPSISPFYPQQLRDEHCILRVWPSLPVWVFDYPPGAPGAPDEPLVLLQRTDWTQVQDLAIVLLRWMQQEHTQRARAYMPLENQHVTVELWSGSEAYSVPSDATTRWT